MVLITGSKGFVGSELMQCKDYQHVLDKADTYEIWCSNLLEKMDNFRIETVVHCGAISDNQYKDADIFDWNTRCTQVIAEECASQGIHLIFLSSQTARNPQTLYGYSKHFSELLIRRTPGLDACIFQPFNIWGDDQSMKPAHCQSLPYRLAANNLEVLWDIDRDYIHVSDVVRAIKIAMNNRICGTFHLGTGQTVNSHVLANAVKYDGYEIKDTPPYIERYTCANPSNFLPGWKPRVLDVADRIRVLESELIDPFDVVEISTKRANKQAKTDCRDLTDAEMMGIECSAQQRDMYETSC